MRHPFLAILLSSWAAHSLASPFCPWKIPSAEPKADRFINFTVVQSIEQSDEAILISYGGGNLGSGHELKIPTKSRDEGSKLMKSMLDTAKQCDK
jgi:hypothetical protein